jgi:hypothetical protein
MSELIPAGSAVADSTDFTIAAGGSATLYLKPSVVGGQAPTGAQYILNHKTPGGAYVNVQVLNSVNLPINISGIGTFNVHRNDVGVVSGMDIQQ